MAWNMEALQRMAPRMKAALSDAEEWEIHDEPVRLWLKDLRDVAHEADDVLDEYEYELLHAKVDAGVLAGEATTNGTVPFEWTYKEVCDMIVTSPSSSSSTFWSTAAHRIQRIQEKLKEIWKQRDDLQLLVEEGHRRPQKNIIMRPPPTAHLLDVTVPPRGREDDMGKVISMLLSDECHESNLFVVPIVGIGGVGKTTLAQMTYNNSEICGLFPLRGWVSVSDVFDLVTLTSNILEVLMGERPKQTELSVLQEKLLAGISGKRFLLVLDDVWTEDLDLWNTLLLPLQYGKRGSAIITTARSQNVAGIMAPMDRHHRLGCLSEEECWEVIKQNAFQGQDARENNTYQELVEIGKQIAKKCNGLPLAAKSLGSLLCHCGYDVESWRDVLDSKVWDIDDKVIPALMLSYVHLPSYVKQCFMYASVFPKGFIFQKGELVRLWMAQGYIRRARNRELETVGNGYFDELFNRSFLQNNPSDPSLFVMHDLIHDLAQCISQGESVVLDMGMAGCLGVEAARHLSLQSSRSDPRSHVPDIVRTVLTTSTFYGRFKGGLEFITQNMLNLRVLSLRGVGFRSLPEAVGNLKHLRYLNLKDSEIDVLPDSVGNLYHLQTLILGGTGIQRLPKSIQNLASLRHLEGGRYLILMPKGIGRLTSLLSLDAFYVGEAEDLAGPEELQHLTQLRGSLKINCLGNVVDAEKAKAADLEGKTKILSLNLSWHDERLWPEEEIDTLPSGYTIETSPDDLSPDLLSDEDVVDPMPLWYEDGEDGPIPHWDPIPHSSEDGEDSTSDSYEDEENPIPIRIPGFHRDEEDSIPDSYKNEGDPTPYPGYCLKPDSHDQQNKVLDNLRPHAGLKDLTIHRYSGFVLPDWLGDPCFCRLAVVRILFCTDLNTLPSFGQLPSLRCLQIRRGSAVRVLGSDFRGSTSVGFPALEELVFEDMSCWVSWQGVRTGDFPHLRRLEVAYCPRLRWAVPLYDLPVLEELILDQCFHLASIELGSPSSSSSSSSSCLSPSSTRPLPPLKVMKISGCMLARFTPEDDEHLLLPSTLRDLSIHWNCPRLVEWCQTGAAGTRLAAIPGAKLTKDPNGRTYIWTEGRN